MNTELKNAVKVTDSKAQYDTSAKRLLGQKSILAHILVKTVDEFKGMRDTTYQYGTGRAWTHKCSQQKKW